MALLWGRPKTLSEILAAARKHNEARQADHHVNAEESYLEQAKKETNGKGGIRAILKRAQEIKLERNGGK